MKDAHFLHFKGRKSKQALQGAQKEGKVLGPRLGAVWLGRAGGRGVKKFPRQVGEREDEKNGKEASTAKQRNRGHLLEKLQEISQLPRESRIC